VKTGAPGLDKAARGGKSHGCDNQRDISPIKQACGIDLLHNPVFYNSYQNSLQKYGLPSQCLQIIRKHLTFSL
jgi:hypothetical protein